jgi:hypothetical protein
MESGHHDGGPALRDRRYRGRIKSQVKGARLRRPLQIQNLDGAALAQRELFLRVDYWLRGFRRDGGWAF